MQEIPILKLYNWIGIQRRIFSPLPDRYRDSDHRLRTNVSHSAIRKSLYAFLLPIVIGTAYGVMQKANQTKVSLKGKGFAPRMGH